MTQSLLGRLLIGVISLLVIGVLISDIVTYEAMQSSLISRINEQLQARSTVNTATAVLSDPDCRPGPATTTDFPSHTITELLASDGSVVKACRVGLSSSNATPVLPRSIRNAGVDKPGTPYTVAGTGGVSQYQVTNWAEDSFGNQTVVFAIPLTGVQSTLGDLLLLEVKIGLALNGMLAQIESAFAERTASNRRLRRFVADASHELRTPLTSIRGYSEMLRRGAAESPTDAELARRRIEEEAIRMTGLVDDMLVLARVDQGRPLDHEPVDLQAIAGDAAADARAVAPQRDINLTVPGRVVVNGDDTRLRQVVGNLVRNALVHTPPKTPIDISLSTEDSVARLSVADHGPGLAADDIDRIFEPFYRADPSRSRDSGGAGLGLSIVSAVVTAHGGHVKVRETEGGGATFEVELPLAGT